MRKIVLIVLALVAISAGVALLIGRSGEAPAQTPRAPRVASAVFAGGCFWCTESDFDHMPGVLSTLSGYTGGRVRNPTYEQVSAGNTGHIEAVRVAYDPGRIDYITLVERFFRTIDPLDSGGSFCDRGYQYRSAIFVATPQERRIAEAAKARVQRELGAEVTTLILPRVAFYRAEEYHQDYYRKNPVRYRFYRWNCGREARLRQVWEPRR
ncbi:MAG TPA: peptide-methionine (S)-S-oxide reductase MsrA [Allosphingosinicella sp.]|nr:peptide-methionine (S)-S-oxide reductase MsrA [Allosphingosinicella sp.]